MLLAAGCRSNSVDQSAFKSAINDYYRGKLECLWSGAVKFPAQADTSNDEQTKGFDALTDAGMLTRASAEKKRFLIGSKQVNNYDIREGPLGVDARSLAARLWQLLLRPARGDFDRRLYAR